MAHPKTKIPKQLFKEFGYPICISIVWTAFNIKYPIVSALDTALDSIKYISSSFFLSSWLIGQFFRVEKQLKTQDSIDEITKYTKSIIVEMESRTDEIISNLTGGDSFPTVVIGNPRTKDNGELEGEFTIFNDGKYTLFDIYVRIVDITEIDEIQKNTNQPAPINYFLGEEYTIGTMMPNTAMPFGKTIRIKRMEQKFNIFFSSRNGHKIERLYILNAKSGASQAWKVTDMDGREIGSMIPENFPKNQDGNPEW